MTISRRQFTRMAAGVSLGVMAPSVWTSARAQGKPIKIGFSLSLTGPVSVVKSGLIAHELWRDDINAAGGILGRPVELVVYDDQSSGASIPGIYSKLVDVDKVDILYSPYGANLTATIMPFIKQRDRFLVGMFGLSNNDVVKHEKFFQIAPWGPNATREWARGYFDLAKARGFEKVAILAADAEFSKSAAESGKKIAEEYRMKLVMDQSYPPNTADFSAILRSLKAAAPEVVFVCSYPPDSTALIRGITEIGLGRSVQLFGGSMVGPQYASLLETLGSSLNGIVNFHTWVPEPTLKFPGIDRFLARYEPIAKQRAVDSLGHYFPPCCYAAGQIVAAAANATGSLDQARLAQWLHSNPVDTIIGRIRFDETGNWSERRVLMVQYRGVKDKNVDQFRSAGRQIVVDPPALRSGELIHPFSKARA
jgi:branched-chain amino acid transport system substrate-binding protein